MDFKRLIFDAARDGKLYRLRAFLELKPKEEVAMLVSSRKNGVTPLIMSCMNGHLNVALYFIKKCNADIEQVGSSTFHGTFIYGATPLWYAAASGNLNLVKVLIKYKASANNGTKTNCTPLQVACLEGHFEMVKYLIQHGADIEKAERDGRTCLWIACRIGHYKISKYLVECGADVNRKTFEGYTALQECAKWGNLDILKLLLDNGATLDTDYWGATPLLSAAATGHASIVEYLIQDFYCTKLDKINALELLGAACIDKKGDMIMGVDCWRRAMYLRFEDNEFTLEKPIIQSPLTSCVNATEVCTFSQLEELISNPADEMRNQALLVRERIMGAGHPVTVHYIKYRAVIYAENKNFDRCMQLCKYALDVQQKVKEPLCPKTQDCLIMFTLLLSHNMSKTSFAEVPPSITFQGILQVLERAVKEIEAALEWSQRLQQDINDIEQFHRALLIPIHLAGLMCRLLPHFGKREELQFKKSVHQLVRMNPRALKDRTPLHLACLKDSSFLDEYDTFTFPSSEVVDLLLEVGACPNTLDSSNNTPLHIAAMNKPCATSIIKSLLNHGAHLDIRNSENRTPLQLIVYNTPTLEIYPLRHITLQCLCAQVIQSNEINYKGNVHRKLAEFVNAH